MIRKIWQTILNLWRKIFPQPKPPAPPKPTPIRSFGEYEQKFMELLEGVEQGWSRGTIQGFLIGRKIKDAEWEKWLQEFGERLLVSPETNLELGRRMVRLGAVNCGRISVVAGKIGRELLAGESLNPTPADDSLVGNENIVTRLLAGESLSGSLTDNSDAVNQGESASQSESIGREISQEAVKLYDEGIDRYDAGDLEDAIAAYETALEIDPKFHYVWNGLGNALNGLGRYSEAKEAFEKSLKIDPQYHSAWNGMGNALKDVGSNKEAIAVYEKTLEFTDDQYWEAWFNRGWAFFNSGRYIEAIQNWDEGLQKYLPNNRDYRLACGRLHQAKGKVHYIHGKQTATYWESFHKAKASYEQACKFLKSPPIPETYLEVLQGLITVCRSLGYPKASEYLTEATILLEQLILETDTHPEIKLQLPRKFAELYQLEVDTLVHSGDKVNALEKAELRKNFCLQWMRATSQNHIDSPTYPEIRHLLANNTETVIIYWHLSPVSLTTFIITSDKFEVITTPLRDLFPRDNTQSLEKWLKDWKTNYQNYSKISKEQSKESHPWRQSMTSQLQKLADILKIPEICTHLTNIQHLILIPHRDLHLLPLHILFSDHLFTITYLPSIQVGIDRLDRKPSPSMSLLLVESPDPLLFAEIEAPVIANFYLNCNTIPSSQATTDNLKEALQQPADIFHFTGHAYHNTKQPSQSALILKNKQPLTSEEIAKFDLKSYYLVCLSACETGITGKEELIDEFVGLASSFLAAGAVYALSTLWIVDEISTALMMIRFYEILNEQRCQNKLHPALALKETQKWLRTITYSELSDWYLELSEITKDNSACSQDLRDEANLIRRNDAKMVSQEPPYADIYYWAGFTITGKVNS